MDVPGLSAGTSAFSRCVPYAPYSFILWRCDVYQTCTEFGYYQTSDDPSQPFGNGFGLQFSVQQVSSRPTTTHTALFVLTRALFPAVVHGRVRP